ncbi:hypothetical protein [Arthrobacter castelli]|uniref:hypothetical protein n=1 Tax=Arthrobacter castelli TaxID=271431 RepID=UPI00041D41E4|nr:hypothetical protein [Arthrobacter castelli]
MDGYEISLFALATDTGTATIDLGRSRSFVAWATVTMIDSLNNFDRDNAVTAEVFKVDGSRTWAALYGGDHFGESGASSNVHQGAYVGFGRKITFRIRSVHSADLATYGMGVVLAA